MHITGFRVAFGKEGDRKCGVMAEQGRTVAVELRHTQFLCKETSSGVRVARVAGTGTLNRACRRQARNLLVFGKLPSVTYSGLVSWN